MYSVLIFSEIYTFLFFLCKIRKKYILDEMDPRNAPRMAYWLSSLLQSDLIENYVKGQIERKYEILYLASAGVDDSKRIIEDLKIKGKLIIESVR